MRKLVSKALVLILLIGALLPTAGVYASDISKNQSKLENINKDLKKIEKKLEQSKNQQKEAKNELVELDRQLQQANSQLDRAKSELATCNQKLERVKEELNKAEEELTEHNLTLEERIRVMYKNGAVGYLEVLLESKSFADFISRFDAIRTIVEYDLNLLTSLTEKKEEIETKKEEIHKEQQRALTLKNQLESKANEVKNLQVSRQKYVAKLESDIAEYEKQERQLERDSAQIQRIIQEAIRRQQGSNNSNSNAKYTGGAILWPVPGHTRISSPYGWRIHPIFGVQKFHTGIDIPAPTGTPFIAPADGTVTYAGYMGGYGYTVIVDIGGGISILGAHNSKLLVSANQNVSKGQAIARIGSTGNSTGPHSHFEVRKNGNHTNPLPYVGR